MPDTPVERSGPGAYPPSLEARVAVLEALVSRIDSKLDALQAGQEALRADVAELRGMVRMLPTTWQMITGIIGGNIALAGALAGAVYAVLRSLGH
jgi:hypothetical protein